MNCVKSSGGCRRDQNKNLQTMLSKAAIMIPASLCLKKYKTERHACCPSTRHAEVEAEHHDGEERWRACRHADLL